MHILPREATSIEVNGKNQQLPYILKDKDVLGIIGRKLRFECVLNTSENNEDIAIEKTEANTLIEDTQTTTVASTEEKDTGKNINENTEENFNLNVLGGPNGLTVEIPNGTENSLETTQFTLTRDKNENDQENQIEKENLVNPQTQTAELNESTWRVVAEINTTEPAECPSINPVESIDSLETDSKSPASSKSLTENDQNSSVHVPVDFSENIKSSQRNDTKSLVNSVLSSAKKRRLSLNNLLNLKNTPEKSEETDESPLAGSIFNEAATKSPSVNSIVANSKSISDQSKSNSRRNSARLSMKPSTPVKQKGSSNPNSSTKKVEVVTVTGSIEAKEAPESSAHSEETSQKDFPEKKDATKEKKRPPVKRGSKRTKSTEDPNEPKGKAKEPVFERPAEEKIEKKGRATRNAKETSKSSGESLKEKGSSRRPQRRAATKQVNYSDTNRRKKN